MHSQTEVKSREPSAPPRRGDGIRGLRWWICGLIFLATTINYIDRTSLSALKPTLEKIFHWDEADYGWIMFCFTTAYAIFPSLAGRLIDSVGVKVGLAVALIFWSAMAGAHALVGGMVGFCTVRFFLGAAEAANFPASIKAIAQWFPQKERALATGLFNSGTNVGVMGMPLLVALADLNKDHGWKYAFVAIGLLGLVWLIFWIWLYHAPEQHPRLAQEEYDYIKSGIAPQQEKQNIHWTILLRYKEIWPFLIGKFLTDPVWWFYLFWLVPYLAEERGMSNLKSAGMLLFPYSAATIGSILGGWVSGHLIGRGWRVGPARYTAMACCALCMPGSIIAAYTSHPYLALALISLATAGHQGWSANLFTTATDLFPSKVAGSVVGLGATTGAIGGMLVTLLVGVTLQVTHSYHGVFIWAGLMHPLSLVIYWLFAGSELRRVDTDAGIDASRPNLPLIIGGLLVAILSAASAIVAYLNWNTIYALVDKSTSVTAGVITAAVLIASIGLVLFYAGTPKRF